MFQTALEVAPNNTIVMNNLAMAYLLDKKIDKAEQLLRRAAKNGDTKPRLAQNLALALTLKNPAADRDASKVQVSDVARKDAPAPMGVTRTPSNPMLGSGAAADQ